MKNFTKILSITIALSTTTMAAGVTSFFNDRSVQLSNVTNSPYAPTSQNYRPYILPSNDLDIRSADRTYPIAGEIYIDTYNPRLGGFGFRFEYAANFPLSPNATGLARTLFGPNIQIPNNTRFSVVVEISGNSGGTASGQPPESIKAQLPYAKYAPIGGWFNKPASVCFANSPCILDALKARNLLNIPVNGYSIYGNVIVDSTLIRPDGTRQNNSTQHVVLSIHSAVKGRGEHTSTFSPDTLHLYDEKYPNRYITGNNENIAVMYKVRYGNWNININGNVIPLPNEADKFGVIVMLSENVFGSSFFPAAKNGQSFGQAIAGIGLFNAPLKGRDGKPIGKTLTDIFR